MYMLLGVTNLYDKYWCLKCKFRVIWSLQDHGKWIISQLPIVTNDTVINRIRALTKANSCDTYGEDPRKIVSCRAVTNPELNISQSVLIKFQNSKGI